MLDAATRAVLDNYFDLPSGSDAGAELLRELEVEAVAGGSWLFRQGDPGDALYLLVRGRLQVWREDHPLQGAVLLGEMLPGESVGEVGLLTGEARSASVRAIRDSVLVRIGRDRFEQLAARHTALVMRLAGNVARLLRDSTTGARRAARTPRVIALRPLDASPALEQLADRLALELARQGAVLDLRPGRLKVLGAPEEHGVDERPGEDGSRADGEAPLGEALRHWISEQEDEHRFVLLRVVPGQSAWARFAERQSDLTLLLAEADADAQPRSFEAHADDHTAAHEAGHTALVLLHEAGQPIRGTRHWLDQRRLDFHLHVRADRDADIGRVGRVLSGTANGLVLGGGAARGFAHLGVHRAMIEAGIPVDWVGGTSIGAIMGAVLALDLPPEEALARAREAFVDGRPFGDYTIPLVSLLRGERMRSLSRLHLGADIEDLPIPFFCVSSNINSGRVNLHERGPIWRATSASAALPGVLPPMVHRGELAVDGAVLNNLPIDVMETKPVGRVFAVELSSRTTHRVDYEDVPSPWAILRGRLFPFATRYRVPGLATMLLKSTEVGTRARVIEMGARAEILFRPPVQRFGMMQVKPFDDIVEVGYRDAQESIRAWRNPDEEDTVRLDRPDDDIARRHRVLVATEGGSR